MTNQTETQTAVEVTDITALLVYCTDDGWEVVEWYGDESIADDLFDTKAEAIKAACRACWSDTVDNVSYPKH